MCYTRTGKTLVAWRCHCRRKWDRWSTRRTCELRIPGSCAENQRRGSVEWTPTYCHARPGKQTNRKSFACAAWCSTLRSRRGRGWCAHNWRCCVLCAGWYAVKEALVVLDVPALITQTFHQRKFYLCYCCWWMLLCSVYFRVAQHFYLMVYLFYIQISRDSLFRNFCRRQNKIWWQIIWALEQSMIQRHTPCGYSSNDEFFLQCVCTCLI